MRRPNDSNPDERLWIFGDYKNYFQNRVTLQLIAKGKELAARLDSGVGVLLMGSELHQYAMEYVAHGADSIIAVDHPALRLYGVETYTRVAAQVVGAYKPDILLAGATPFCREFFPRLAKRLGTGLSADCVAIGIQPETGLLLQSTPAFGGDLIAEVVTPKHRPQMATVHPGLFREHPHDVDAVGRIFYPDVDIREEQRVRLIESRPEREKTTQLSNARIVIAGGRGVGDGAIFQLINELATLLDGEVGATRPVVRAGWAEEKQLLGQTGESIKPRLLITIGTSGALQYTAGIVGAEVIVAVNRDPRAPIFRIADVGYVGDARVILPLLVSELRKRL